jgi:hypothetical protein
MATQTVIWTALPNGVLAEDAGHRLRLSVSVSPRLRAAAGEGDTLGLFPDFHAWPARMLAATFEVAFDGGPTLVATMAGPAPELDFWAALFKADTFVRPYTFDDHAQRQIVSYPVRQVLDILRWPYQRLGIEPADGLLDGHTLLAPPGSDSPLFVPLEWNADTEALARDSLARGQDISRLAALARLLLFHHPPALRPEDARLPETEEDFRKLVDFHEAVSSLGDYPELLRRLGLVLDLEMAIGDLADGAIPPAGLVRVLPTWPAEGPQALNYSPWTAYRLDLDTTRFEAAPRSQPIQSGMLALEPGSYGLVQVDVDGAAIKINNTMLHLQRSVPEKAGLPSLRSGGISLVRDGRAEQVRQGFANAATVNAALESGAPEPARLFAEDLVRGYRIDIWDSQTTRWHSLCRRIGTYRFVEAGIEREFEDEGWVQLGARTAPVTGNPAAPDDLYLHESLFRWEGWSLTAQRPGKALSRQADPAAPPEAPVNEPATPFKLVTSFRVPPASLPRLRFGTEYRVRARVADLAGNGPGFDMVEETGALPAAPGGFPYLRFEPVAAPAVVLRAGLTPDTTPGESLERLVIRSFNASEADDTAASAAVSERHIAPPRTSQLSAEVHGKFDRHGGGLKVDAATYALIRDKDEGQFRVMSLNPLDPASQAAPVEPDARLTLPYLPDPLARGAAFQDLPGAPNGTLSRVTEAGVLVTETLPGPQVRPGNVTQVDFGAPASWPEALPFRLVLAEGNGPPVWDAADRVLTVSLPKAQTAPVLLSSYLVPDDLRLMGVWQWIREELERRALAGADDPHRIRKLEWRLASVVQRAREGGHWMISPARTLALVHAVQQPLGRPQFEALTAFRQQEGATAASFVGTLRVHGRSTSKVDLLATWQEPIDALDEPGPRAIAGAATADEVPLADLSGGSIRAQGRAEPLGIYEPGLDEVRFNADAHPRHEFGDTKHRTVRYRPVSTSRFREYFPPDVPGGLTRAGDAIVVDVPSSARPEAPRLLYVLPTFGWQRQTGTNLIGSRRSGGLRVYLDRPWFSSGEDELLGVVYTSALTPATPRKERERLSPYVTQWGFDPVHASRPGTPAMTRDHFPDAVSHAGELSVPELPGVTLAVAAHRPAYAPDRQLWYCDITVNAGESYFPFVRLALARYQPHAMVGVELSRIVAANIAQVAPDRSVIVTYDPYDPDAVNVVVAGFTYDESRETLRTEIEVWAERQYDPGRGELGWGVAPGVSVTASVASVNVTDRLLWHGQVNLPPDRAPGEFRVTVKEYERYIGDGPPGEFPPIVRRLVYAEGLVV